MENKEFTPIAMKCNEAQFKEVEPILIENGFETMHTTDFENCNYLINNPCGIKGDIINITKVTAKKHDRKVYEEWDKETFLKACGIEVETKVLIQDIEITESKEGGYVGFLKSDKRVYTQGETIEELIKYIELGIKAIKEAEIKLEEEPKIYTCKDLSEGRVACVNDGKKEELIKVIKHCFRSDVTTMGIGSFYFASKNKVKWEDSNQTDLPTQSVKVFLQEIELEEVKIKAAKGVNIIHKSKSVNDLQLESLKREIKKECDIDYTKYIGRKVKGFKFESFNGGFFYDENMNDFINVVGTISKYIDNKEPKRFKVEFDKDFWFYPAEEAINHLVEEPTILGYDPDNINPKHYKSKPKETIERIKDNLTPSEFKGYLKGNILKYLDRYENKNGVEDLKKANWYLNKLIEIEQNK